ncbi:uncharacterized protein LOC143292022 [Babylonia areolata]|uniref:uncharacterized protein LOC143292022 n=1 Tax=Babylonia areolata TaxID=304850 RepID=UPI003FD25A4D
MNSVNRVLIFVSFGCVLPDFVANRHPASEPYTDFKQATFQQIFRFTYFKQENGTCTDLSTYLDLLENALDASEKSLPSICTVQRPKDRITGQMKISGIAEQSQTIIINISVVYDLRPTAIYEQCKGLVASAFQRDDGKATAPFRDKFSPLLCPSIDNRRGGVLVQSGYFCRLAHQVRVQVQPGGSSHPIDVCVYCPLGEEVVPGSGVCTACRQGHYKSSRTTALCEPCPPHFVTRISGSTTKDDCQLRACDPGFYADVYNGGQCTPCPHGTYQPEKWKEQCIDCPAGLITYQRGADNEHLCLPICPQGQEFSNDTQSCQPCPRGYFSDGKDAARLHCVLCSLDYITAGEGATSSQQCNIRNCSQAGQYLDVKHNVCQKCPRGQWQNHKWQTSCNPCNQGFTTRFTGTTHPSYCFVVEDQGGFKLTKEEIIMSMVSVLILLIIGNLIIVGYCVYSRSHRKKENINPSGEGDTFKMTEFASRRPSGTYEEDTDVYDTIGDVTSCTANSTSTFEPIEEREGSSHNYDDLNVYLQPRPADAVQMVHTSPVPAQLGSDDPVYDDVLNTCPIYQNFGSRSPLAESDMSDELWSSRLDVLY